MEKYFFYQYNHDPEFPSAKARPYIALRHINGLKIVEYEEDKSWSELFDTNLTDDPYEINNLFNVAEKSDQKLKMQDILIKEMASTGFLKSYGIFSTQTDNFAQIQLGKNYNFSIYSSLALDEWNYIKEVKGNGTLNNYSLLTTNSNGFQIIVNGNSNDHNIINSNFGITKNIQSEELIIGAKNSWDNTEGGDGILYLKYRLKKANPIYMM